MKRIYDYRIDMNLESEIEINMAEAEKGFAIFMKKIRRNEPLKYQSTSERKRFLKMVHHMKRFSYEQSALLEIIIGEKEGRFIFKIPETCVLGNSKIDQLVMNYMKRHITFIETKGASINLVIIVAFWKCRKKLL